MDSPFITRTRFFSWYLTKYISLEVLVSFVVGTSVFLFIMLMFQAIRLSEFVVVHQVGGRDVSKLSVYLMLSFLPIAIPIAFLFSVLMGISRANSEGEITALQANGISPWQIFAPLGMFSGLLTLVCLYFALFTVPAGNRAFELLITRLSDERVMSALKPGVFVDGFFGLVLFAERVMPMENEMKRIFIYDERDEEHPLAIMAHQGVLKRTEEKVTLRLIDGSIYVDRKRAGGRQQKITFDVYDINLDIAGREDSWREYSPPSYNFTQLKKRLSESAHDPTVNRQLQVEVHRRFSLAFSCIVFAALGFIIGVFSHKGIRSAAIVLCLFVALIYWISYVVANALASTGLIFPWLGIWFPNVALLILCIFLYLRWVRR